MGRRAWSAALAAAVAVCLAGEASALTSVSSDVFVDTVWGDDPGEDEMLREQPIFVKNDATLAQRQLVGADLGGETPDLEACNLSGVPGCAVNDVALLLRLLAGEPIADPNGCDAWGAF